MTDVVYKRGVDLFYPVVRSKGAIIVNGDCADVLQMLPDQCVQMCVTSPPYFGLRDYGVEGQLGMEKTPEQYVSKMVTVFREVRRVLKDDGTLWLNLGDSYAGYHGNKNSEVPSSATNGWTNGTNENARRSTANRNGLKPKDLIGIPWRVAFALQADGWYLRQDIIWHKPNPMPESVRDRCTKAHEYIFLLSKSDRYYFDSDAMKEPSVTNDPRRPYTSKGAKDLDGRSEWKSGQARDKGDFSLRNKRSVWTVSTKPYKGAHFATFPSKLIEPCVMAGSRPGDTVLDVFGGSGTTAKVAIDLQRSAILCELNPKYIPLSISRIGAAGDEDLFN